MGRTMEVRLCGALWMIAASATGCRPGAASAPSPVDAPRVEAPQTPVARQPAPTSAPVAATPPSDPSEPFVPGPLPDGYLAFDAACTPGESITIGAVGDVLVHRELQRQALRSDDGFANIWAPVLDLMRKPDLMYANLEGPAAWGINRRGDEHPDPGKKFDNRVYTGYARFNYHPSIAADLASSGVDVVSTANNHTLDRLALGVDRTLDALDKAKLDHFGARRQGGKGKFHTVTHAGGFQIAWVACTLHMNYQQDEHDQVMQCYEKPDEVTPLIKRLSRKSSIDAVIVTPHIGKEYATAPRRKETELVHRYLEAGALAVLGSHPHVTQPWERYMTKDGRETFAIYSLGNFCSHQRTLERRSSLILYLGLTRDREGVTRINGVRHVPIHARMEGDKNAFYIEAVDRAGGPADSRAVTVAMYGEHNLLEPDADIVTNPQCDPGWKHHAAPAG